MEQRVELAKLRIHQEQQQQQQQKHQQGHSHSTTPSSAPLPQLSIGSTSSSSSLSGSHHGIGPGPGRGSAGSLRSGSASKSHTGSTGGVPDGFHMLYPSIEDTLFLSQVVDTCLFRVYLDSHESLVGPLLRVRNFCEAVVVERELLKREKVSELVDLYFTTGEHRKALELLKRFVFSSLLFWGWFCYFECLWWYGIEKIRWLHCLVMFKNLPWQLILS
jgi:hypothetical protein